MIAIARGPRAGFDTPNPVHSMRFALLFLALISTALAQTKPGQPAGTTPATPAPAPTPQPAVDSRRPIWRCNLSGGTYQVVVNAMLSVSSHEYVVDGAARVTEVNVDTTGQLTVRFYFIEPATTSGPGGIGAATLGKVQSLLTEAAERSGTDAWKKVVKSYPTTTHARTVEYRVSSKDALNKIFASASNSLTTGKPGETTVSD